MGKWIGAGLFLVLAMFLLLQVRIDHTANVTSSKEIDVGVQVANAGTIRYFDGDATKGGMNYRDAISEIMKDDATKKPLKVDGNKTNGLVTVYSFKAFTDEEGKTQISHTEAYKENLPVKSIQYKVDLYKPEAVNSKGELTGKDGKPNATSKKPYTAVSSTENRLVFKSK